MNLSTAKTHHLISWEQAALLIITMTDSEDCGKFALICEIAGRAVTIISNTFDFNNRKPGKAVDDKVLAV